MNSIASSLFAAVVIGLGVEPMADARPTTLGTAFTYQGQLKSGGANVSSTADFQFTLWDAASGGAQVAGPASANGVTVVAGQFTTSIDFGSLVFNGQGRWLEIAARSPAGGGAFTTLAPRQPLTATPYALQTRGVFVDANNNVGIGTTATPNRLTVNGGASFNGNVTIGTDAPLTKLMISANENVNRTNFTGGLADGGLLISNKYTQDAYTPGLFWHTIDEFATKPKGGVYLQETDLGSFMHFNTSFDYSVGLTNDAMVINPSGFVGIGTPTPEATLHVSRGSAGAVTAFGLSSLALESSTHNYLNMLSPAGTENGILFGHPFTTPGAGGIIYNSAPTPSGMEFRTGGNATRMRILSNGRVSIGSETFESGLLHVEVPDASQDGIVASTSRNAMYGLTYGVGWTGVIGESFAYTGAGRGVSGRSNSPNGYDFYADGNGVHYGTPSSRRWKHNIMPIDDPLGRVAQIRGVWYDWDAAHGGKHDVGMIAEEVGKVMPEIVAYEANGIDANGMDYSRMSPLLVEAVKALRAEKDAQIAAVRAESDAQIEAFRAAGNAENAALRARLDQLERMMKQLLVAQNGAKP